MCVQASEDEGSPDAAGAAAGEAEEEGAATAAKAKPLKKAILTYPGDKAPKARSVLALRALLGAVHGL